LHLTDICLQGMLVTGGRVSMKDIQFPERPPARDIEGLGENTRAWEILERDEAEDLEYWSRFVEQSRRA
jgi:hypothetical protein